MPRKPENSLPNIQKRVTPNGHERFRVRIRFNGLPSLSITFETEKEACDWLQENYYCYKDNLQKYLDFKKKKW